MRVNILVSADVFGAVTIEEARKFLRSSVGAIDAGSDDDIAMQVVRSLSDAVDHATHGSLHFPTPADIERKMLTLIEPDVSALLGNIEASLITGEATTPCSGAAKTVRQEVTKRLIASGWTATFADDPRGEGTAITVVPSVVTS